MDEVVLFQGPRRWGIPNPSPFCVKVETWMRLAGVPYRAVAGNPMKAPRGKIPWIEHEGRTIPDSEAILAYLRERFGDPLGDGALPADERARGRLVQRTLEDGLYFLSLHDRWIHEGHWPIVRQAFFGGLPAPVRAVVPTLVRRKVRAALHGQGVGRLTDAEREGAARRDLEAVAWALGDRPFFHGDRATTTDALVYGFLVQAEAPFDGPLQRFLPEHPALLAWKARVRAAAWPDAA